MAVNRAGCHRRLWEIDCDCDGVTVEQALNELASHCLQTISFNGIPPACHTIPQPRDDILELLAALDIIMLSVLPFAHAKKVVTKAQLQNFRKK